MQQNPFSLVPIYIFKVLVCFRITSTEWVDIDQTLTGALGNLTEHVTCRFLQQYYSQVLGLQVLVNSFDRPVGVEVPNKWNRKKLLTKYRNFADFGAECFPISINCLIRLPVPSGTHLNVASCIGNVHFRRFPQLEPRERPNQAQQKKGKRLRESPA